MSIHSEERFNIKRDLYVGVSVKERVDTLMLRVARTKAILSCLGLERKPQDDREGSTPQKRDAGGRSRPRGSPELIMRLDKEPVGLGAMG
jgi:hypothetical protein